MSMTDALINALGGISLQERLARIAAQLEKGEKPDPVSVRTLLSWFNAQRRGSNVVWDVRRQLRKAGLATQPDFDSVWIDATVEFVPYEESTEPTNDGAAPDLDTESSSESLDPTFRIGKLESASKVPVSVAPDAPLTVATTLMLAKNYSQLPVMTTERDVKGIVSWGTIGKRASVGKQCGFVRECMDVDVNITSASTSLFDAIEDIIQYEYVLIRDADGKIGGIVTPSDLSRQFRVLSEPFLILGEIESHIRSVLDRKLGVDRLRAALDPSSDGRDVKSAANLSFGEYVRAIENPDDWATLDLKIDRKVFLAELEKVRLIRNRVVHFDPDGTPPDELLTLKSFLNMLQELRWIGAI